MGAIPILRHRNQKNVSFYMGIPPKNTVINFREAKLL
jgi:hypothetical protein